MTKVNPEDLRHCSAAAQDAAHTQTYQQKSTDDSTQRFF